MGVMVSWSISQLLVNILAHFSVVVKISAHFFQLSGKISSHFSARDVAVRDSGDK